MHLCIILIRVLASHRSHTKIKLMKGLFIKVWKGSKKTNKAWQSTSGQAAGSCQLSSHLTSEKRAVSNPSRRALLPEPRMLMGRAAQEKLCPSVGEWNHW